MTARLSIACIGIALSCLVYSSTSCVSAQAKGSFTNNSDVGAVLHPGSASFNAATGTYELSGAGSNIWFNHDEFQYCWKKMSGNFIIQARGRLLGTGVEAHRKFGLMVRTGLDPRSATVATTVHGDGLTALQYRKADNDSMMEVRSTVTGPDVIQLERRGDQYIMSVAHFGEPYTVAEVTDVHLGDEVYIGLFVCSHNKDVVEKASLDNVRIIIPTKPDFVPYRDYLGSNIEVMDVSTGNRTVIYSENASLQAPNWSHDGKYLIYNSKGIIRRLDLASGRIETINTDSIKNNNNDHVISFDGKMIGLSSSSGDPKFGSLIYTVPIGGGKPKQITPTGPSYLHGWSPDGKFLIFTGQRNNEFDLYKVPSNGGPEVRLTNTPGLDDGSEYSPDGKFIYFNSVRSGTMQLWRMKPDGSDPEQLTNDEFNNWFPHVSPDGKSIVFLSFQKDVQPGDHPFYKHVYLRMMPAGGGAARVIGYLYGGQGSINTPSWSPDSKKIAFVSNTGMQ